MKGERGVRVTMRDVYDELVRLRERVGRLELITLGLLTGIVGAIVKMVRS